MQGWLKFFGGVKHGCCATLAVRTWLCFELMCCLWGRVVPGTMLWLLVDKEVVIFSLQWSSEFFLLFFLRNRYVRLDEIILNWTVYFFWIWCIWIWKFQMRSLMLLKVGYSTIRIILCQICLFWKLVESNRHSFYSDIWKLFCQSVDFILSLNILKSGECFLYYVHSGELLFIF